MNTSELALTNTASATDASRFNAVKHAILSKFTILPWETGSEYDYLHASLVAEHGPQGPTEEHLVEEIAGIIWRKRRLRMAEASVFRRGLSTTTNSYGNHTIEAALAHVRHKGSNGDISTAIVATSEDHAADLADIAEDEAMTRRALDLLGSKRKDTYAAALAALREDTQDWWREQLEEGPEDEPDEPHEPDEDDEHYTADAASLRRFLENEVVPDLASMRADITNRPLIREQAIGEALDPNKLEPLARYEVHLDRKLERMLTMLMRLKELRGRTVQG